MENYTIILALLGIMILLTPMAHKIRVAAPILLIIAGIGIGFIPDMPAIEVDPEIIFLVFLPPLLYDAAFNISFKDFREHIGTISSLAFGLVFLTTACIAATAHFLIPGMSWALSFVLGAILAATDAVAAMGITKGLGISEKTKIILEGESLVNDASALVAYRFAVSAVAGITFVWWKASLTFLVLLVGGVATGFVIGFLVGRILKMIRSDSVAVLSFILLSPFVTYLVAEEFHFSGVIAVVVLGITLSQLSQQKFPEAFKKKSKTIWDVIVFMLNGFIFIILGMELPIVMDSIAGHLILPYAGLALVLTLIAVGVRTLRVFLKRKSLNLAHQDVRRKGTRHEVPVSLLLSLQESAIISASGMRGIVSLAIAIGLPYTLENGQPFPFRPEIIFITTLVILFSIVGQGLLLTFSLRRVTEKEALGGAVKKIKE